MRAVSSLQRSIWLGGDYAGVNTPCARVTVQVPKVNPAFTHVSTWRHTFNPQSSGPKELFNLKSLSIDRGVDTDVASATMEFYNTATDQMHEFPGTYTPRRGYGSYANRWPTFQKNQYQELFVPDRVLRTYQGYGSDMTVKADQDTHLVQTGEWWIDNVEFTHDGLITVKCRDRAGPGLVDQICFPPVIPANQYPLRFEAYHTEVVRTLPTTAWSTVRAVYENSSNFPYMSPGAGEYGHYGQDAFDSRPDSYWLSIGNIAPTRPFACEWVQGTVPNTEVSAVTIRPWKGNYTVYISIFANGYWHGSNNVPYDNVNQPDNGSVIPYVLQTTVGYEQTLRMVLDQTYNHVTKVRVSLTNLYDSNLGPYQYRGGIRSFVVERKVVTQHQHDVKRGNYGDYSEIVKKLLSWGGFFWPNNAQEWDVDGDVVAVPWAPLKRDPIVDGRVWGDIEMAGTAGPAALEVPIWDKKPLMDCVHADTPVKTKDGFRRAGDIELGDEVANRGGYGRIIGRKTEAASRVVSVAVAGERLVTSPGHLYWTERGWIRADHLAEGDRLRTHLSTLRQVDADGSRSQDQVLRESVPGRPDGLPLVWSALLGHQDASRPASDLFGGVSEEASRGNEDEVRPLVLSTVRHDVHAGTVREEILLPTVRVRRSDVSDANPLRDVRHIVSSQGVATEGLFDEVPTRTGGEPRVRRSVAGAVHSLARAGRRLAAGILDVTVRDGGRDRLGSSGSCIAQSQGLHRGRRPQSRFSLEGAQGRDSRRMASVHRVDGVAVLGRGDFGWAELCDGDGEVRLYDFSVEGDPSFVVGRSELVVHNCVSYIRDILGYIFFVDEEGAAVFRSPNIWQVGNFLQTRSAVKGTYTRYMPELDERTVLRGLRATLSKRNSRSRVFVGNADGRLGAVAKSREPYPVGWNRVSLWTDQNFKTQAECQVMADLITLRQLFSFREDALTISANPALQPDDQVRIFERVTGESYIHYIKSISSRWDNETREWTMDLTTHWLGEQTYQRWAFDPQSLSRHTYEYLVAVGKVKG